MISACIDGGMVISAPKQNPVKHDITMNILISPESRNRAKIKKTAAETNENDQVLLLVKNFPNFVQNGIPIKANKK